MSSKKEKNRTRSAHDVTRRRLDGRAIIVTRARAQSAEITDQIEALGGTVIHCPTVECIAASDSGPLDSAIDRIDTFDWILFTSANAVTFFCNRLIERQPEGVSAIVHPGHLRHRTCHRKSPDSSRGAGRYSCQ